MDPVQDIWNVFSQSIQLLIRAPQSVPFDRAEFPEGGVTGREEFAHDAPRVVQRSLDSLDELPVWHCKAFERQVASKSWQICHCTRVFVRIHYQIQYQHHTHSNSNKMDVENLWSCSSSMFYKLCLQRCSLETCDPRKSLEDRRNLRRLGRRPALSRRFLPRSTSNSLHGGAGDPQVAGDSTETGDSGDPLVNI